MLFKSKNLTLFRFFSTSRGILEKKFPFKSKPVAKPAGKQRSGVVKEVILSWLISKKDLENQKRKAIESILSKGDKLQIRLENKNRSYTEPTPAELEARDILLKNLHQIVENAGGVEQAKPNGTIKSRMMLYFAPK